MKKLVVLATAMGLMVALFAGVALAKVIDGNGGNNTLVGTPKADTMRGYGGNDLIRAVDSKEDDVECGRGFDRVTANPGDDLDNCERVIRDGVRVDDRDDRYDKDHDRYED